MELGTTVYVTNREGFRNWLEKNSQSAREIWLVIFKVASGMPTLTYEEALEEAICFGWIDSQMKSIDAEKYAQRFTPRISRSNWTETNKERALKLIAEGRMTEAGLMTLPKDINYKGHEEHEK
jgi:uncharacterized protein YdeI (YjbR/CyaY-like superfamily)